MSEVVQDKDHETLFEAQRVFSFLISAWTKVDNPSVDQMISATKNLDSKVQATRVYSETGAWKRF